MTTLEAVNEILAGLGQPPVTALETGTTSEAGEAETYLNNATRRIQRNGWSFNRQANVTLALPNRTVSCSGGSGTFTYGETITQATSTATGTFYYEESGKVYLVDVSGTFDASNALTGGTSSATRATVTATDSITSAKHAVQSSVLMIRPSTREAAQFSRNSGFLFDTLNNTATFTAAVVVDQTLAYSFANMPEYMHEYAVQDASVQFQRYKRRGLADDQFLIQELIKARINARQADQDNARINVFDTMESLAARGYRRPIRPTSF